MMRVGVDCDTQVQRIRQVTTQAAGKKIKDRMSLFKVKENFSK